MLWLRFAGTEVIWRLLLHQVCCSGRGFAQSAASLILSGERGLQIVRLRSFDSTYCSIQKVQPTLTLGG